MKPDSSECNIGKKVEDNKWSFQFQPVSITHGQTCKDFKAAIM